MKFHGRGILIAFVFVLLIGCVSAAREVGSVPAGMPGVAVNAGTGTLIASALIQTAPDVGRQNDRRRDVDPDRTKNKKKDKFHGAEMSSGAVAIAGLLALSAYFWLVRRKSQRA